MSQPTSHKERILDLSCGSRGVWLVKVPKYISNKWEQAPGNIEVGKLKITKVPSSKAEVSLRLADSVMALKKPGEEDIPQQHRLDVTTVTKQTLGVFSHIPGDSDKDEFEHEKLFFEGKIVQKLECRPDADMCYMRLKKESIKRAAVPVRSIQTLDRAVQNFKPVSDHKHNIEYAEKKKAEGKKMRDDKNAVTDMLFAAFEKHQYYNIKDLVKITRQPIVYLKEILQEVCHYNLKNPHRNLWELKPEYRCYKDDKPIVNTKSDDSSSE